MTGPRIGYLVKAFPVVSETFILNEIRAMEHYGVPLAVMALKPAPPAPVHGAVARLATVCHHAPTGRARRWPGLLLDHLRLAVSYGPGYRRAFRREVGRHLGSLLRRPDRQRRRMVRKRLRRFLWAGWVAQQARRLRIEHLHAHYASEPLRVAHLVQRIIGTSYSFTAHAKDLYLAPASRLRRRLESARFATSCHRDGVATLLRLASEDAAGKVRLVRHGLDLGLFRQPARNPHRVAALPRILAVGRLTPKKGFDDLVTACAALVAQGRDLRCDIVGDGRLRRRLERQIRALGLRGKVRLRGFVPQEEIPAWHARATLLAAPCKELADGNRDGVPNVVLEAMASGLPIVASAAGSIPEVLRDGENGLLIEASDPEGLATAMARLLDDPQLASRLSRAARRDADPLDYLATNRGLALAFEEVLASRLDAALDGADAAAWSDHGLARKARKRLGLEPASRPAVEASLRAVVRPGLAANGWRPDLERLAGRRLWDEVVKAPRLGRLIPLLLGSGNSGPHRILDLGSGRGGLTVALRARGFESTALDMRYRNCHAARLRGRRYDLDIPSINALGEALPLAVHSFDAVACLEVLEHVENPAALLQEIRRVLRPGGRCVVTVINRWAHLDPHYHLWGVNFMPRRLGERYVAWRRRAKTSYRDRQTLGEMHYFSYRGFVRWARELGFAVEDPSCPESGWRRLLHLSSRRLSLGFNTVTLVLRPTPSSTRPSTQDRNEQDDGADHDKSQRPVVDQEPRQTLGIPAR